MTAHQSGGTADRFEVFGAHRGGFEGVLEGYEPAALRALNCLVDAWDNGRPRGLLNALSRHARSELLRPAVRDRLRSAATSRLAARCVPLARQLTASTSLAVGLANVPGDGAVLEGAARQHTEIRLFGAEQPRVPVDAGAWDAWMAALAADTTCGLLSSHTHVDPVRVCATVLSSYARTEWAQAFGTWEKASAWLEALPLTAWMDVWARALIAGNVHTCPAPIGPNDTVPAAQRRAAFHAELKALNASMKYAHLGT